jgi:hypothetical protein
MSATEPNPLKKLWQIGLVVKSLDESMKTYMDKYGIGPWSVYTFDPSTTDEMVSDGERKDYACRLAVAQLGDLELELIEPLDDHSRHAQILRTRGEGVDHLCFSTDSFTESKAYFIGKGVSVAAGGTWHDTRYEYLSTQDDLKFDLEIQEWTPEMDYPAPERTYPPNAVV